MEIKVGEYVRFKNGLIDKVIECRYAEDYKKNFSLDNKLMKYERNKYWFKNRGGSWTDITFKKHSYNIIDLIEEGDYVDGIKVKEIYICGEKYEGLGVEKFGKYLLLNEIKFKSIVTKEQFSSLEYII